KPRLVYCSEPMAATRAPRRCLTAVCAVSAVSTRRQPTFFWESSMSTIVSGRFDGVTSTEALLRALPGEGFERSDFQSFFVTPPGQHATFPVGGDAYSDEGAKRAGSGAINGALMGAGLGLVAGIAAFFVFEEMIAVLAGVGLGAYVGSLIGALS